MIAQFKLKYEEIPEDLTMGGIYSLTRRKPTWVKPSRKAILLNKLGKKIALTEIIEVGKNIVDKIAEIVIEDTTIRYKVKEIYNGY